MKYARGALWCRQDIAHGAAPLEARRPVATSIAFELVRAALCLVSLASNALCLQETSLQDDPEVSGAIQALWQQQEPAPQQRFASPV